MSKSVAALILIHLLFNVSMSAIICNKTYCNLTEEISVEFSNPFTSYNGIVTFMTCCARVGGNLIRGVENNLNYANVSCNC